ncbi:MAG: SAF domain-containing protein [Armatimonadetes bacterium]|nr:SAF domain-containing protein [Armatimonadota bacterium]
MRRRLVVPVVAAVMALVPVSAMIGRSPAPRQDLVALASLETEPVVFARHPIAAYYVVGADALEIRKVPEGFVHPRAARRIEDAARRLAVADIDAGEQVLLSRLAPAADIDPFSAGPAQRHATWGH